MTMFHAARFHNSGRLFVSEELASEDCAEIADTVAALNEVVSQRAWPSAIRGEWFLWHPDLTRDEVDQHRPSESANMIK